MSAAVATPKVSRVDLVPRLALRMEESADAIGVSVDFFEKHVMPELKCVRRGRLKIFPVRELERWLVENAERLEW